MRISKLLKPIARYKCMNCNRRRVRKLTFVDGDLVTLMEAITRTSLYCRKCIETAFEKLEEGE